MSAKIYTFPDRRREAAIEAVLYWEQRAIHARNVAAILRRQLDDALGEAAECDAMAVQAAKEIPPCPASVAADSERSSLPRKDPHP